MNRIAFRITTAFMMLMLVTVQLASAQDDDRVQLQTQDAPANPLAEQAAPDPGYVFTIEKQVQCTPIKNQGRTGTCWCFATASFIESEVMRMGKGTHDLSEMFIVRNIYLDKGQNYLLRQGKTNFGEGALAHDFIRAAGRYGMVPDEVYSGLQNNMTAHDHSEMAGVLEAVIKKYTENRRPSSRWREVFNGIMDVYLGPAPTEFSYQGKTYTPKSFAQELGFDPHNYISLTSYTHHPFGESFPLEIPDNFSSGQFLNVPIDDLVATIDNAIANGYSVAWDGDVSERGFSQQNGLAVLPKNPNRGDLFQTRGEEMEVTQDMRQETLLNFTTTDDHLMHLVGIARDPDGKKYYIIKNSWGPVGKHQGLLYMSEAYVRLKTVAILIHKDAMPKDQSEEKPKT